MMGVPRAQRRRKVLFKEYQQKAELCVTSGIEKTVDVKSSHLRRYLKRKEL